MVYNSWYAFPLPPLSGQPAARREARVPAVSGNRNWSFTKGPKLAGVDDIYWSFNFAQVNLETSEVYCAGVRRLAESILADSASQLRSLDVPTPP